MDGLFWYEEVGRSAERDGPHRRSERLEEKIQRLNKEF